MTFDIHQHDPDVWSFMTKGLVQLHSTPVGHLSSDCTSSYILHAELLYIWVRGEQPHHSLLSAETMSCQLPDGICHRVGRGPV